MNSLVDITQILAALISVCTLLVIAFIIPKIKASVGQEKIDSALSDLEIVKTIIQTFVTAAEQKFPESGSGAEKKEYVTNLVKEWLNKNGMDIDLDVIDAQIESAVYDINQSLTEK